MVAKNVGVRKNCAPVLGANSPGRGLKIKGLKLGALILTDTRLWLSQPNGAG